MPQLTVENLQLFLYFIVPGFVALKVYDLFVPGDTRDFGNTVIELIAYSMINLGLTFWAIDLLTDQSNLSSGVYYAGIFGVVVVSPALMALGIYRLRAWKFVRRWILDPAPTAWDSFFGKKTTCWVLFHLKTGKKVGGFFGRDSYASSYPTPPEIYVEQVWTVDKRGAFLKQIPRTFGMVVRYHDCSLIEFLKTEENDG